MLHEYTDNEVRLAESLTTALAACKESQGLSADVKMELARNCLSNNMEEGAADVMRDVMRNAPNNAAMLRAMSVFEKAGHPDLAATIAQESRQAVIELVAAGAVKAKAGDYRGAVTLMLEAVAKLPDNPQVVFNAAVAVLKCLENLGWEERLGRTALGLIDSVRRLDPVNPKLPALAGLHQLILKKYDKGTRAKKA
jgi:Flp pilus assembly protein TadD